MIYENSAIAGLPGPGCGQGRLGAPEPGRPALLRESCAPSSPQSSHRANTPRPAAIGESRGPWHYHRTSADPAAAVSGENRTLRLSRPVVRGVNHGDIDSRLSLLHHRSVSNRWRRRCLIYTSILPFVRSKDGLTVRLMKSLCLRVPSQPLAGLPKSLADGRGGWGVATPGRPACVGQDAPGRIRGQATAQNHQGPPGLKSCGPWHYYRIGRWALSGGSVR